MISKNVIFLIIILLISCDIKTSQKNDENINMGARPGLTSISDNSVGPVRRYTFHSSKYLLDDILDSLSEYRSDLSIKRLDEGRLILKINYDTVAIAYRIFIQGNDYDWLYNNDSVNLFLKSFDKSNAYNNFSAPSKLKSDIHFFLQMFNLYFVNLVDSLTLNSTAYSINELKNLRNSKDTSFFVVDKKTSKDTLSLIDYPFGHRLERNIKKFGN